MKFLRPVMMWMSWAAFLVGAVEGLEAQEWRQFTSKDGKTLQAEVISVKGFDVKLRRKDGKQFTLSRDLFVEEDQEYIKQWAENDQANRVPKLEVWLTSRKGTDRTNISYDDKRQRVGFRIAIENEERGFDLLEAKAEVVAFGREVVSKHQYKVLLKDEQAVNVREGEKVEVHTKVNESMFDNRGGAQYGFKYYGVLFRIINKNGKVIYEKASQPTLEAFGTKAYSYSEGQEVSLK